MANYGSSAPAAGASQRAIAALVLALAAFFCCGPFTGIPAAIVGWMELGAINSGQSSPAGKWMAQVGLWVGIAASVIHSVIGVLYFLLAILSSAR